MIKVLVVDDNPIMRNSLKEMIESSGDLIVVDAACNGQEGLEKTLALRPDVITMDLKMPVVGGVEAIQNIMSECPTPIIIVSSLDVRMIVEALGYGAMDYVVVVEDNDKMSQSIVEKVRIASKVKALRRSKVTRPEAQTRVAGKDRLSVVALGISTGGPQSLPYILSELPDDFPGCLLVVQHISVGFIAVLVEWLRGKTAVNLIVAQKGMALQKSCVYFAPDAFHLVVKDDQTIDLIENKDPKIVHVPSIDVLMSSVAEVFQEKALGVLMTGMGQDGAQGMRAIKESGGQTIAQDEETSVIFGMNKVAIDRGYADVVSPLNKIAAELLKKM